MGPVKSRGDLNVVFFILVSDDAMVDEEVQDNATVRGSEFPFPQSTLHLINRHEHDRLCLVISWRGNHIFR